MRLVEAVELRAGESGELLAAENEKLGCVENDAALEIGYLGCSEAFHLCGGESPNLRYVQDGDPAGVDGTDLSRAQRLDVGYG
jgi:hypothetical protein